MKLKTIIALMVVMLALGCTDDIWTEGFDGAILGKVETINLTAPPPCRIFQNYTKPTLTRNWTVTPDDNIRSRIGHYNEGGKEWKYITMYNATCHQIPCGFEGAYCLECEEYINQTEKYYDADWSTYKKSIPLYYENGSAYPYNLTDYEESMEWL